MEETSEVRLVRCPKCGNILPELPNFSVFQCGGCLAVLQAKPKENADNGLSEASGEGERRGVDEKGENNVSSENVIKDEVKNDDVFGREEEGIPSEKSISNGHSALRTEERGKMVHGPRFSQGRRIAFDDNKNYRPTLRKSINDDVCLSEVEQKFANYSLVDEIEGIRPIPISRRTNSGINDRSMGRNGANSVQQGRFVDEGPSNYGRSSYRGYDGLSRVAHLEKDRAELLKKLDELKEQISKSGELLERPDLRSNDPYHPNYFPDVYHPHHHSQRTYMGHFPNGHGYNQDLFMPHPYETTYHHQLSCSCSHCMNRNRYGYGHVEIPTHVPSIVRSRNDPTNQQQFTRPRGLMNYENGGFNHQRARQVIVSKGGAHVYRPMGQGAPFITCLRCFELLKIPVKVLGTNQGKVKCGACSSVFELEYGPKGIVLSVSGENKHDLEDVSYFSDDIAHDWLKQDSKIPFYGGDGHSDSVPKQSLEDDDDELPSLEDSLKSDDSANLDGKNAMVEQVTSRQGSMKEAPVASEMDISGNDYTNSGISQYSTEISKEVGKSRINKFAGLLKRSFKDFARSGHEIENEKPGILINGHMIPDRLLKKAEKVAGPIQHGEYWYDYRAGFWGVMGHPCLGIIPPRIEEFKSSMSENCSNGDTQVYVNGRELHQKDLDLLSSRGLPITRHKYYLIEISGKVVDEQTGEELDSLGKLAPTVQRVGHGFGMKYPKSIAQGE